jgi:hypothetical protein
MTNKTHLIYYVLSETQVTNGACSHSKKAGNVPNMFSDTLLDSYERRARLTPGILGIAPASVAITTLGVGENPAFAALAGLLSLGGGAFALAVAVGNLGRKQQPKLWELWGGAPTTQLLRSRSVEASEAQTTAWRHAVENVTRTNLLDAHDELDDPERADAAIDVATNAIRHLGHGGSDATLAAKENAQYGYERNVLGFRWVGRSVALGAIVIQVARFFFWPPAVLADWVGIVLCAGLLLFWTIKPSRKRTREAGFRYAAQLLNAVARQSSETNPSR